MSVKQLLFITAVCFLGSGCRLGTNFVQTSIIEPIHFARNWDNAVEQKRFRHLARCAFENARAVARAELDDYQHEPFSEDARSGFEAGFVDYLDAGGIGHLPPLPPRRYWKATYETPEGQLAMQEWFSAYKHGAAMAEASGYRQFVTVTASDSLVMNTVPYYGPQADAREAAAPVTGDETEEVNEATDTERFEPIMTHTPPILESEQSRPRTADLGTRVTHDY